MKNLIKKIEIETMEETEVITSPCQINGYYDLEPQDQMLLEELDTSCWEQFIMDCLLTKKLDNQLAKCFEK